jgi:hypothetical protein
MGQSLFVQLQGRQSPSLKERWREIATDDARSAKRRDNALKSAIEAAGFESGAAQLGTDRKFQFFTLPARLISKKCQGNSLRLAREGSPGASDLAILAKNEE